MLGAWPVRKDGTSWYLLAVPPIRPRWLSLSRASLAATVFTCTSNSAATNCPRKFTGRTQAIRKFARSVRPFSQPKLPVSAASHVSPVLSAIAVRKSGRRYRGIIRSGRASNQLPRSQKYLAFLRLTAAAENPGSEFRLALLQSRPVESMLTRFTRNRGMERSGNFWLCCDINKKKA